MALLLLFASSLAGGCVLAIFVTALIGTIARIECGKALYLRTLPWCVFAALIYLVCKR